MKLKNIGLTSVNPLTLQPWAHDWDNPIEKNSEKKLQRSIPKKLNVKGWNWFF